MEKLLREFEKDDSFSLSVEEYDKEAVSSSLIHFVGALRHAHAIFEKV